MMNSILVIYIVGTLMALYECAMYAYKGKAEDKWDRAMNIMMVFLWPLFIVGLLVYIPFYVIQRFFSYLERKGSK